MFEYTPEVAKDWTSAFNRIQNDMPWRTKDWMTSIGPDQLRSKKWIVDTLSSLKEEGTIQAPGEHDWVCQIAAWNNPFLSQMLIDYGYENIVCMDMDPDAKLIHNAANKRLRATHSIEYKTRDVVFEKPDWSQFNLIINTSCEHMYPMKEVFKNRTILPGTTFVFQGSNLYSEKGHIMCVDYVEQLIDITGLTEVHYANELQLSKQKRFMVVGTYE